MLEKKPTMRHTCISSESPNYLLNFIIDYGKNFTFAYKVVNKHENKFGWDGLCQIFWENHLLTEGCVSISEKKTLIDRTPLARSLCH